MELPGGGRPAPSGADDGHSPDRHNGGLPGRFLDSEPVDMLRAVMNLLHQLLGVQPPDRDRAAT
jgi:hypothetical protein